MKTKQFLILCFLYIISTTVFSQSVIENTDYIQIISYGQSLGMGWQSPRAITTTAEPNTFMVGNNPLMQFNNGTTVLNPLIANTWNNGGEQPIVGCVNAFARVYRANVNPNQKFIGMSGGQGGQTIEKLSKECTNSGYYASTFTKTLNNTVTALQGKTVSCPAIIFMQGEYNCKSSSALDRGLTLGTNGTTDKDTYKALLLKLKNNMQADIMLKYGQKQKPLFFMYQVSGSYIPDRQMPIVMAQIEFANENPDVIIVNPHYAMPHYGGGHLSTNGYRWYGELMAKSLYEVLVNNSNFKPVYPTKISINSNTVTINFHVPAKPLVFDTWTTAKVANFGFNVYKDTIPVSLTKTEIVNDTTVVLTSSATLTGQIEVNYCGVSSNGKGNLRDCDTGKTSIFTYFDDSTDALKESYTPTNQSGVKLYGSHYPLQNWSIGYYYKFNVGAAGITDVPFGKSKVYPNPGKNFVNINYNLNGKDSGSVKVYNSIGKLMFQRNISASGNQLSINTKNFSAGSYFYNIVIEGRVIEKTKFIIQ